MAVSKQMYHVILLSWVLMASADRTIHDHDHHDDWCEDHHDHMHVFEEIMEYLNVTNSDVLLEEHVDQLIIDGFYRLECDKRDLGNGIDCSSCLTAENIADIIKIDVTGGFDEHSFEEASTIMVAFMSEMEELCPGSAGRDWSQLFYSNFTEFFMHYNHDHDHDHLSDDDHDHDDDDDHDDDRFSISQMEWMMRDMNATYRVGYMLVDDNGNVTEEDKDLHCSSDHFSSFTSRDVFDVAHVEPEDGATVTELGHVNSAYLLKMLYGECMEPDRFHDDGMPDEDDFVTSLFQKFADPGTCVIGREGYDELLHALDIGHDDHDHDHGDVIAALGMRQNRQVAPLSDHDHDHEFFPDVSTTCYDGDDLLMTYYQDVDNPSITREVFISMCPALVQQATEGCRVEVPPQDRERPSDAEIYGYGTLSVFIISLFAPLCVLVVKFRGYAYYCYVIATMLGLAVGALVGDSLLHLIPHGLGLHDHTDDGHDHSQDGVEEFVWKMLCACASIWTFFLFQQTMEYVALRNSRVTTPEDTQNDGPVMVQNISYKTGDKNPLDNKSEPNGGSINSSKAFDAEDTTSTTAVMSTENLSITEAKVSDSQAWMVSVGDFLHNLADGMAIGAAFTIDWQSGLSTSIAVLCHEVPHELGDTAVMLSAGWSPKKVLVMQTISALGAFIGLYIGIPIAESSETAQEWIFVLAAGMFLYVALADVVPEMIGMMSKHSPVSIMVVTNCGLFLGFLILLIIAIFEGTISI